MSISATDCHGYRALSVASAPVNPTVVSVFAWVKSTADNSAYRGIVLLDAADGLAPDTGMRFSTDGSDSIRVRATTGGAGVTDSGDAGKYFFEAGNRNAWVAAGGVFNAADATNDLRAHWYGPSNASSSTGNAVPGGVLTGTLDDFYLMANGYTGSGWGGQSAGSTANFRAAYFTIWLGYALTTTDMAALKAGTHPLDIGTGATRRWCWEAKNAAGGLADLVNSVTMAPFGGTATATWHDADNPTVSDWTGGGGGGGSIAAICNYYRMMRGA